MASLAKDFRRKDLALRNIAICNVEERDLKIASLLVGKSLVRVFKKYTSALEFEKRWNKSVSPLVVDSCVHCPWLLAFFYFTATIPYFLDSLGFMDRKFQAVCFWYSQYKNAQDLGHKQAGVNLKALVFSLKKLRADVFQEGANINFQKALDFYFDRAFISKDGKSNWDEYIPLSPEWIIDLGEGSQISRVLENLFSLAPTDCVFYLSRPDVLNILGARVFLRCVSKPFFYMLETFISVKNTKNGVCFFTFIKTGSVWYRCGDEGVRVVGMNAVKESLRSGVLLRFSKKFQ